MGYLSNKIRQGAIQKCINNYLKDIPDHAKFLMSTQNFVTVKALAISHIHRARQHFNDLEVILLYKEKIDSRELGDHLLVAEKKALEFASKALKIKFSDVFEEITSNASIFAKANYDGTSADTLIKKLGRGNKMSGKSSLWRQIVFSEILYLAESEKNQSSKSDSSKLKSVKPIVEILNKDLVKKPGTSKPANKNTTKMRSKVSPGKSDMKKHFETSNVINFAKFDKEKKQNEKMRKRKIELANEPAYLLSIPSAGWSWYCDYHEAFGVADTEHEALWMGGAHMHYFDEQGDLCEMNVREW